MLFEEIVDGLTKVLMDVSLFLNTTEIEELETTLRLKPYNVNDPTPLVTWVDEIEDNEGLKDESE